MRNEHEPSTPATLWVIADIHANAAALEAALALVPEDDRLVVLGDLLTYGCAPERCLELVEDAVSSHDGVLLVGNHDQLYLDMAAGKLDYYESLPDWLRETVDWTRARLDVAGFARLPWQVDWVFGDVLFSHANPYGFGDWTYLNTADDYAGALVETQRRGASIGVFGHSHRARLLVRSDGREDRWFEAPLAAPFSVARGQGAAANPGSLGQPRSVERTATMMSLQVQPDACRLLHHEVAYDVDRHVAEIREASFSDRTRLKLLSFFGVAQ